MFEEKEKDCCKWSQWHTDQSCSRGLACIEPGEPLRSPDFFSSGCCEKALEIFEKGMCHDMAFILKGSLCLLC